ncbi:aminotransferase class IV [Bacillus sp. HC-Mk]
MYVYGMFLINGYKQESLAVSDRATQFGDGCFTTARVIDGKVSLLSAHIQRLQDACQRLMISCDFWPQLEQEMKTLAAEQQNGPLFNVLYPRPPLPRLITTFSTPF